MANHAKVEPDTWESVLSAETIHEANGEPSDSTPASVTPPTMSKFCLDKHGKWDDKEQGDTDSEGEADRETDGDSATEAKGQEIYSWRTLKSIEDNPKLQNPKSKVTFAEIVQMVLLNQYCGGSTRFCGTADNTKFLDTASTFLDVRPDATGQARHLSIDIVTSRYIWALKYMF
jgi:hypothetical protein